MKNYLKLMLVLLIVSPCAAMPKKRCANTHHNLPRTTVDVQSCPTSSPCSPQSYVDKKGCSVERNYNPSTKSCVTGRICKK